jgi:molecular chaperone GrpE
MVLVATIVGLVVSGSATGATLRLKPPRPPGRDAGTVWNFKVIVARKAGEPSHVPTITIRNRTTGERRSVAARPTGTHDVYGAKVVFRSPGNWTYSVRAGNARRSGSISIVAATDSVSTWKTFALVASALALVAGAAVVVLLMRRPTSTASWQQPVEPPPDLVRDREALIGSCLYLYDIVRDDALRERLRRALAQAGVSELDSVGERFDPSRHRAMGRVATDDPSLDGRIAEVERRGFSDRGRILRMPEVLVYSARVGQTR